jgi:hypothetical protein
MRQKYERDHFMMFYSFGKDDGSGSRILLLSYEHIFVIKKGKITDTVVAKFNPSQLMSILAIAKGIEIVYKTKKTKVRFFVLGSKIIIGAQTAAAK